MNSLKKQIATELLKLLNDNASIIQIAQWADEIYSNYCRELDKEMDQIITRISFMQLGPEFEINRTELENIAKQILK